MAFYRKLWKERRRNCRDLLGQMCEGMNKKEKVVCELAGVETDAEAGANIKDLPEKPKQAGGGRRR